MSFVTVSDVAREFDVRPSIISAMFYARRLRDDLCPVVGGRRLIPRSYVEVIAMELRRDGKLPPLPKRTVAHA